jgi:chromosome segregation ATPase
MEIRDIPLKDIRLDGATQIRVEHDKETIEAYAEAMEMGSIFPPVVVFNDGVHNWLADGFHRYFAAKRNKAKDIAADVRSGDKLDAQKYAFTANTERGLSLSRKDKRKLIIMMLSHPETSHMTNAAIARQVGVTKVTVGRIKAEMGNADTAKPVIENTKADEEDRDTVVEPLKPATSAHPDVDELLATIEELNAENQRLRDALAAAQWDATEIEKIDVGDTLKELREQIRVLEMELSTAKDSRDMYQNRNAELLRTVNALKTRLRA